jgi:hypothetical protein
MKDSDIAKNLIKMKFIPLIGQYHKINLDCPIEVPGIVKTKNK